ncbi:MAG: HEPN domain-containing protein [Spirochaetota bacterium]|nr:HEPN domain-containing protein [Spirochaetota bacterium]
MSNKSVVKEWINFSTMDLMSAKHLYQTMHPIPLEIVCYHCQQSVEKMLKAMIISINREVPRTHDLGLLLEVALEEEKIPETIYDACDNLTPFAVKFRYPQELFLEDYHAKNALADAEFVCNWCLEKGLRAF